jgi:exodeoxyribonuclease V beta subunit
VLGIPSRWSPPLPLPAQLAAAAFERTLDQRWRRTSYTDITAGSYDAVVASEAEEPVVDDEPVVAVAAAAISDDGAAVSCPLAEMGVGAEVGTVVHRVLAASEFDAVDLDSELERRLAAAQGRRAVEVGDPEAVVGGLRIAVQTPLGPLLDDVRLCDVRRADRLDELEFELPLAGGDQPDGWLTLSTISRVLRDHLTAEDALAGYAERLADPVLRQNVRGYLTGSLDLVVRIGTPEAPRFAVLDYKTNWLGGAGEELTVHHYRPEALAAEMYRHHYALQALLYTVALHRYLRWRVPRYSAEHSLAGVLYLFLRGMVGDPSHGVFAWKPPAALVQALSDALDQGVAR